MTIPNKNEAGEITAISQATIEDTMAEAQRACTKHGSHTPRNLDMPRQEKLPILVEELGEVARCITYDREHAGELYEELIQLATMALMWATAELGQ